MTMSRPGYARFRHRRVPATLTAVGIALLTITLPASSAGATPVVGGSTTAAYTERAAATGIGQGLTVQGGSSYAGQFVEFAVGSAAATDLLSLAVDGAPVSTAGIVSVVGSSIYLGNGSGADPIGSIDSVRNGQGVQPLRVNFTSAFVNPGFETGNLTGWTAINQRIDLGVTSIAGFQTVDTSTYPANVTNGRADDFAPTTLGSLTTTVQTAIHNEGAAALRLVSTGMTTAVGCDVVHGPAVYSSTFEAAAGDTIYFDWRAYAGADNYHVFGYIVDTAGNQTEVLDATGGGTSAWTTKATVIPTNDTYRFVFVSGTHDATCGQAAGASLVIDNVRVYGTKSTDAVVQQVASKLLYSSTSHSPPATRTVTVTAASAANGTGTGTVTIAITPVDEAPTLGSVPGSTFTNTEGVQVYPTTSGTLAATDPESDPITFGSAASVASPATVDGVAYTHATVGTYGTLHVNALTGAYAYVPDPIAIDARRSADSESFTLTATTQALTASRPFVVDVAVPASAPGAPGAPGAVPGVGQISLAWTAGDWTGGSPAVGYLVESSLDGTTWTVVTANTGTVARSAVVSGLAPGTTVSFRVSAINATGTSVPSSTVTGTTPTAPGQPAVGGILAGNRTLTVHFTPPASDGGTPIRHYEYSIDGGTTWIARPATETVGVVTIGGLVNAVTYPVRLRAINDVGAGTPSLAISASPFLEPVLIVSGTSAVRPSVPAGTALLLVDGSVAPATTTTPGGVWTVAGSGFTVTLQALGTDGAPRVVDAQDRLVLTTGGAAQVSGTGFRPGSLVDVWLFSTPYLLGQVVVGGDGTFAQSFALPGGVELGAHTVQLNGVSGDGAVRSVSTGVVLTQPSAVVVAARAVVAATSVAAATTVALAFTGSDPLPVIAVALLLVAGGVLMLSLSRRRRRAAHT